ncbi:MAG: DMT family transporter [Rhodobacteraceae bacterium]|nr:DMT family transporter [Paracoccaceae bacterium]
MTDITDKSVQGVTLISASVFAMAFADAIVKLISDDLTLWQVFLGRSIFSIVILVVVARFIGTKLRVVSRFWVLVRTGCLICMWLFYYGSFPVLSLSVAAVAMYTFPIMTALFATLIFGEPASKRQWLGIVIGFVGVVVILRPGSDAFSWFALLPVAGAAFLAMAMLLTRTKCRQESPLVLSLVLAIAFLIAGVGGNVVLSSLPLADETRAAFPFLLNGWRAMSAYEWRLLALIGVMSTAIFAGIARAYQIAPPAIVATFDYIYLVSAAIWGFVFFAEKPGALTLSGMALIIFAGILAAMPTAKPRQID